MSKIDLTQNLTVSVVHVSYTYSDYPIRHISNQNENDCSEQNILNFYWDTHVKTKYLYNTLHTLRLLAFKSHEETKPMLHSNKKILGS